MSARDFSRVDYPIGVVCALAVEKAAFVAMLDEIHEAPPTPKDDENSYTFGRIGYHNIVAACLPAGITGNNSAATVAKDMLRSFPIKIGLMVGVGGGVWSQKMDIRLGDVVISQPEGSFGGVVQWDFGKMEAGGFKRTGSLNKPPRPLLNALQDIKVKHMLEGDSLADNLSRMAQKNPRLTRTFLYQGAEHDLLYASTYNHGGAETCDKCDIGQIIERPLRLTSDPQTHYGNIASGNKVVKNAPFRDLVARELGVLCFEMEAAGLMDSFPCLVIRGICDYTDSHKNKRWQPYAAATAAAYAKELLGVLKKQEVDELKRAKVSYRTEFSLQGVPRARQFVDRPAEMAELERVLIPRSTQNDRQKIYTLHGLGGMGKTQLAVEFARRHHLRFTAVFWLDGRSEDILKRSIASCASRIPEGQIPDTSKKYAADSGSDLEAVVRDFMGWLARSDNKDWLLIFDNVDRDYSAKGDDPDAYDVKRYFSSADHGSILITTRLAKLKQLGDSHPLSKVSAAEGLDIFQSWYKKPHDLTERDRLLELLGGLPLAIAQAGAFLDQSGIALRTYIKSYEQQWSELMEPDDLHEDPLQDYSGSVWTTWEISYQAIRQKHEKTANLLLLWSYLDNKDMWHGLFARACKRGDHVVGMLSKWIGNIASSEIRFGRAMRLLRDYSLVEEVVESNSHATHPVVHQWARHSQGRHFQSELSRLAVVIVGGGVPTRPVGDHFELQRRFLPHAQVCLRHILETKAFDCFEANGAFDKGVIQVAEQETLLRTMICLALLFTDQSKLTEANELYKRALKGAEMVLGRKHEMTLGIENNVAILYVDKGKLEEAEKMYNRVLLEREQILGSTHPRTIDTVGNLGSLYIRQGKLVEAEQMLKRALRGREKTYGPSHPSTLDAVGNLGMLNLNKGRLAEAAQMFELVLRGYEDVVGKEGIQQYTPALGTLENMAITYQEQGDIAKAKVTWERALSGYIDLLGPSDDKCKELLRWIEELSACQKDREETERKGGKEEEHEERQHEERKQQTKMTEERGQAAEETEEKEKEEHGNGEGAQITKERRGRKWVRKLAVLMKEGKKGHI